MLPPSHSTRRHRWLVGLLLPVACGTSPPLVEVVGEPSPSAAANPPAPPETKCSEARLGRRPFAVSVHQDGRPALEVSENRYRVRAAPFTLVHCVKRKPEGLLAHVSFGPALSRRAARGDALPEFGSGRRMAEDVHNENQETLIREDSVSSWIYAPDAPEAMVRWDGKAVHEAGAYRLERTVARFYDVDRRRRIEVSALRGQSLWLVFADGQRTWFRLDFE